MSTRVGSGGAAEVSERQSARDVYQAGLGEAAALIPPLLAREQNQKAAWPPG